MILMPDPALSSGRDWLSVPRHFVDNESSPFLPSFPGHLGTSLPGFYRSVEMTPRFATHLLVGEQEMDLCSSPFL